MTLRPNRFYRWVAPIIGIAVAAAFLVGAYHYLVRHEVGDALLVGACGVGAIALGVWGRIAYIRVDDSAIIFGPKGRRRSSYDRRQVARLRATHSPFTRRTLFLRSDGSTLYSTPGFFWGRDGLQSLADYLRVPFEGWGSA